MVTFRFLSIICLTLVLHSCNGLPVNHVPINDPAKEDQLHQPGPFVIEFQSPPPNITLEAAYPYQPCRNPVILVPGLGGSILDYRLSDEYESPHELCSATDIVGKWSSGAHRLWPSLSMLSFSQFFDCWKYAVRISFNSTTGRFENTRGVEVRPRAWGSVEGIDNLFKVSTWGLPMSSVFEHLIQQLLPLGYKDRLNLHGAPYDFRRVPEPAYLAELFEKLRLLIEETSDRTETECDSGRKRVHIMTHSLGGPLIHKFLTTYVDQIWKDKYVASYIPVASPFLGAPKALRTVMSGDNLGLPGRRNFEFREVEVAMGGLAWMMPVPDIGDPTPLLVIRNHTDESEGVELSAQEAHYDLILRPVSEGGLGYSPAMASIRKLIVAPHARDVSAPGVNTLCIFGTGIVTESYYEYVRSRSDADPIAYREEYETQHGDGSHEVIQPPHDTLRLPIDPKDSRFADPGQGDGTVPLESLRHCETWANQNQGHDVSVRAFPSTNHINILTDPDFLSAIVDAVQNMI